MEIPTDLYVTQLKTQRNLLADEVALITAQCHHLMRQVSGLEERVKKQEALLVEAGQMMKLAQKNTQPAKKRGPKPKDKAVDLSDAVPVPAQE